MVIPNSVKIDGNVVPVYVDEEGTVQVGSTEVSIPESEKNRINEMPYDIHFIPWQEQMFKAFEEAYNKEKKSRRGKSVA